MSKSKNLNLKYIKKYQQKIIRSSLLPFKFDNSSNLIWKEIGNVRKFAIHFGMFESAKYFCYSIMNLKKGIKIAEKQAKCSRQKLVQVSWSEI